MARNALGLEFGSAARLSKRPGSVWNCLWGHALKRSPGIIHKRRVLYPGPGFLSSATWPSLLKKHYYELNQIKPNNYLRSEFDSRQNQVYMSGSCDLHYASYSQKVRGLGHSDYNSICSLNVQLEILILLAKQIEFEQYSTTERINSTCNDQLGQKCC